MNFKSITLIVFIIALLGCEVSFNTNARSGSIKEDYIGEPLSERVIEYAAALQGANMFLDSIITKDYSIAYGLFDKGLADNMSEEEFKSFITKDDAVLGEIKEYLKDQWAFNNVTHEGKRYIQLTKIVKFDEYTMNYIFTFPYGSDYKKAAGFTFTEKKALL